MHFSNYLHNSAGWPIACTGVVSVILDNLQSTCFMQKQAHKTGTEYELKRVIIVLKNVPGYKHTSIFEHSQVQTLVKCPAYAQCLAPLAPSA